MLNVNTIISVRTKLNNETNIQHKIKKKEIKRKPKIFALRQNSPFFKFATHDLDVHANVLNNFSVTTKCESGNKSNKNFSKVVIVSTDQTSQSGGERF